MKKALITILILASTFLVVYIGYNTKNKNISGEEISLVNMELNPKEKPRFDAFKNIVNKEDEGHSYKLYYFNMGSVDGVPLTTAQTYKYDGVKIEVEYTISEETSEGIERSLDNSVSLSTSKRDTTGKYISTTKDEESTSGRRNSNSTKSEVTYSRTLGTEIELKTKGFFVENRYLIKGEFGLDTVKGNEKVKEVYLEDKISESIENGTSNEVSYEESSVDTINEGYSTYKSSSYSTSRTVRYTLESGLEQGFYRYGTFVQADVYAIMIIDTKAQEAYIEYQLFPIENKFYNGIQFSKDNNFNEELEYKVSLDVEDVLEYLDYEPDNVETEKFKVTFNSNGGSSVDSDFAESGTRVGKPTNPTKEGYNFMGWYTNVSLIEEYNFNDFVTQDITLYAKWSTNDILVEFKSNGGTSVPSQTLKPGDKIKTPVTTTRDGYRFDGWYTDEGLNRKFDFNSTISKNTKLYAKWVQVHSIEFQSNGGTSVKTMYVESGQRFSATTIPTRSGYNFKGWFTNQSLTQEFNNNTLVYKDYLLYAKWEKLINRTDKIEFGSANPINKNGSLQLRLPITNRTNDTIRGLSGVRIRLTGSFTGDVYFGTVNFNQNISHNGRITWDFMFSPSQFSYNYDGTFYVNVSYDPIYTS